MFKLGLILTIFTLAAVACGAESGAPVTVGTAVVPSRFEVLQEVRIQRLPAYNGPYYVTGALRNNGASAHGELRLAAYAADGILIRHITLEKQVWESGEIWRLHEMERDVPDGMSVKLLSIDG